jgi:hypothetical protein
MELTLDQTKKLYNALVEIVPGLAGQFPNPSRFYWFVSDALKEGKDLKETVKQIVSEQMIDHYAILKEYFKRVGYTAAAAKLEELKLRGNVVAIIRMYNMYKRQSNFRAQ